jgi:hypothetical protein
MAVLAVYGELVSEEKSLRTVKRSGTTRKFPLFAEAYRELSPEVPTISVPRRTRNPYIS